MSSDPRIAAINEATTYGPMSDDAAGLVAWLDKLDPLRLALREPSDELIERLSKRLNYPWSMPENIRAVLAAFAEAVTPDDPGR